jgi:hypothetical protein
VSNSPTQKRDIGRLQAPCGEPAALSDIRSNPMRHLRRSCCRRLRPRLLTLANEAIEWTARLSLLQCRDVCWDSKREALVYEHMSAFAGCRHSPGIGFGFGKLLGNGGQRGCYP